VTNLDEIWYRSPHNAVKKLWVSQKLIQGKPRFIYQQKSNFYHTSYIFLLIWMKCGMRDISKNVFSKYDFHENWSTEATNYLVVYINFCLQLHIYCPLEIKASIGDLHIMLTICKFHENWHRMDHTFYGCTWNYFTHIPCNHVIFLK
jgi:hypothetical protein